MTGYNSNLFLFMLHNYAGNKDKADHFLSEYVKGFESTSKEFAFFDCLHHYFVAKSQQDLANLRIVCGKEMTNQAEKFLKERDITKYLHVTTCYDCDNCQLKQSCNLMDVAALTKKIENEYIKNIPDQTQLSKLFYV